MGQALIGNLVGVWFCVSAWIYIQPMLIGRRHMRSRLVFATVMGLGAITTMALADQTDYSVRFDLRAAVIVITGFWGGPLAALVATSMAAAFRVLAGGHALLPNLASLAIAAAIGVAGHLSVGNERPTLLTILWAALGAGLLPILSLASVDAQTATSILRTHGLLLFFVNAGATTAGILGLIAAEQKADEQRLLEAAVVQSPDYLYVKDLRSRLVGVNQNVARFNGRASPMDMRGLTDFDLAPSRRARDLFYMEQRVLRLGEPVEEREEQVFGPEGEERWFVTTKLPVRDGDGEIIGLAGVTRDITERRALEKSLADNRDQLSYVLHEVADGIAMFDPGGHLVFCNEQYRGFFPLTGQRRVPGTHVSEIARDEAMSGEIDLAASPDAPSAELLAGEREIRLYNGRWLHLVTRITREGTAMVVVSDISTVKAAEDALRSMTEQLRVLAETDGLTGLPNRRAFDQAVVAAESGGGEISLLMLDVDRFKNYNDIYGHPAGDECLRAVANCLRAAAARPTDMVARYGGEEFVALLPDTGEEGARRVAERCSQAIRALQMPHDGSEKKIVTASIGIATLSLDRTGACMTTLVKRADEALYLAKSSGRDRQVQWRPALPRLADTAS